MSDKIQLIKEEIERLYKHYLDAQEFDSGYNMALDAILKFIDSLPEESASEDLKEEISKWRNHYISVLDNNLRIDLRDIEVTANYFAEWQKQQIIKNAVLETKVIMDSDGDGIENPYEEWLTLENTEIPCIPDNLGLKEGDKVKIIIVKTE